MTEWTKERQAEIREWIRDKSDFTWDAAKDMLDEIEKLQARVEVQEESNIAMGEAYSSQLSTLTRERDEAKAKYTNLLDRTYEDQMIDHPDPWGAERKRLQERFELADKLAEAARCVVDTYDTMDEFLSKALEAWEQGRGK